MNAPGKKLLSSTEIYMIEQRRHRISVVIPARNEERCICDVIRRVSNYSDEIIVVDGHSIDNTASLARQAGVVVISDNKKGKGDAIRESIHHVKGEIIVFIDADGSHSPEDIPKLVEPLVNGSADHVSASRLLGGSSELHGSFNECLRLMGSSLITACINKRFGVCLSESQNGFRAIRTDVIKKLDLRENITTIEQEMIIKSLKKGFRMAEVPSHEYRRKHGESKIKLRKVWFRYVYSLFKYLCIG